MRTGTAGTFLPCRDLHLTSRPRRLPDRLLDLRPERRRPGQRRNPPACRAALRPLARRTTLLAWAHRPTPPPPPRRTMCLQLAVRPKRSQISRQDTARVRNGTAINAGTNSIGAWMKLVTAFTADGMTETVGLRI